jgi:hypothetical protein
MRKSPASKYINVTNNKFDISKIQRVGYEMKVYSGKITQIGHKTVTVSGIPLQKKFNGEIVNEQFEWGKNSKGSEILSYSILADCIDEDTADTFSLPYLNEVIASLNSREFTISEETVKKFIESQCSAGGIAQSTQNSPWKKL